MNYQHWTGVGDAKYGYGSMLQGFLDHAPRNVKFDEKASVSVRMCIPQDAKGWWSGQHRACFTMWESDKVPGGFRRWLSQYDQIIVPCPHNVEVFSRHHDNVTFVPLGVDTKYWSPADNPVGPFTVLAGGSLWSRKGLDITINGFIQANLPDSRLLVKIAPHAKDVPNLPRDPRITYIRDWMDDDTQLAWFRSGHVFVSMSRGEGFGLMPLQAISCGIPTILSDTSGQRVFAHLATGVVNTRKVLSEALKGFWDEANVDHLVETLRRHHRDWDAYRRQALDNTAGVQEYSWKNSTKKLIAALPTGHLLSKPDWEEPNISLPIRVTRNLNCDIGKHHYRFIVGETYQVTETVHQVLYDAGVLEDT